MSLVVTVAVPTGIVMSGDSRTSFLPPAPTISQPTSPTSQAPTATTPSPPQIRTGLIVSDSTYKVFLLYERFGVSTFGTSSIGGMPIAHHIESFELQQATPPTNVTTLSQSLLSHFRGMTPISQVSFQVAGYDGEEPHVYFVNVGANTANRIISTASPYNSWWAGDIAIASRMAVEANIDWISLNVQDAVDYTRHLIRSTIDQMRFELSFPTVGGPIDTLLISPKRSEFLLRKKLVCS